MYTSPKVSSQYTDIMDLLFSEVTQHLKETLHYYFLVHVKRTYLVEKHLIMKFASCSLMKIKQTYYQNISNIKQTRKNLCVWSFACLGLFIKFNKQLFPHLTNFRQVMMRKWHLMLFSLYN